MEELIALLFIGFGVWAFISPKSAFQAKAKLLKPLGIKITAGTKAFKALKYIGLALAIVGFLMYLG